MSLDRFRIGTAGLLVGGALAGLLLAGPSRADEKPEFCPGYTGDSREQIIGTGGDDLLRVPEGAIGCGLGGDDILKADRHGDTQLFGGEGDDVFCAKNNDMDHIYGGDGKDRAVSDDDDRVLDVEGDMVLLACRRP